MSTRDREILKDAHLSQKAVASYFGISVQGINRGISAESDYLNPERLGKLVDLVQTDNPKAAESLRNALNLDLVTDNKNGVGRKTSYVQLTNLTDLLARDALGLIWIPTDTASRLVEEADVLNSFIHGKGYKRLVLIHNTSTKTFEVKPIFDERVYRFDFNSWLEREIIVIESDTLGLVPELVMTTKAVSIRTVFGFQELRENDASALRGHLLKQSKISPDYIPIKFGNDFSETLHYPESPYVRALRYLYADLYEEANFTLSKWIADFINSKDYPQTYSPDDKKPIDYLGEVLPRMVLEQLGEEQQSAIIALLEFMKLRGC